MITGIGIDLLEIERIKKALQHSGFAEKYYTLKEVELGAKKMINNFVAKEAVAKAFGLGFHKFQLRDIEILRDNLGKPYVRLHGNARRIAQNYRIRRIHVSISDTKQHTTAIAVIER